MQSPMSAMPRADAMPAPTVPDTLAAVSLPSARLQKGSLALEKAEGEGRRFRRMIYQNVFPSQATEEVCAILFRHAAAASEPRCATKMVKFLKARSRATESRK